MEYRDSSSLEGDLLTASGSSTQPGSTPTPSKPPKRPAFLRFNRRAVVLTVLALVAIGILTIAGLLLSGKPDSGQGNGDDPLSGYGVGDVSLQGIQTGQQLQLEQAEQLTINGRLSVNDGLVLAPMAQPTSPLTGEVYYDAQTNQPYYYNGQQFISLSPSSVARVSSLQGQTGAVSLTAGSGISISGTTISNSGVLGSGAAGQFALFSGGRTISGSILNQSGTTLVDGGDLVVSGVITASGGVAANSLSQTGDGNDVNITAGNDSIVFTDGGRSFRFPSGGPAAQDICTTGVSCASGLGAAVILQPGAAQVDTGGGASVFINNTGGGNLIELQAGGSDRFVVANNGDTTIGGNVTAPAFQGANTKLISTNGGFSSTLGFTAATANNLIVIPDGSGTVCLSTGNCAGSGGGITGPGTVNTIPVFSGTQEIGDSIITQDSGATTVSVGGQLTATGQLDANGGIVTNGATINTGSGVITGDGSGLFNLNGTNIATGTVADARLSANVTLQGNIFNGASQLLQLTNTGVIPVLSGANLTNLNATNLTSGTVDDNRLNINVALLNRSGQIFSGTNIFQPAAGNDSAAFFQILNAAGSTTLFDADTTDGTIGIGQQGNSSYTLGVTGTINATSNIYVNGVAVCTVTSGCAGSGAGFYINNGTTQQTGNFNIVSAGATSVGAVIQGASGQTADLLDVRNGGGALVYSLDASGNLAATANVTIGGTTTLSALNSAGVVHTNAAGVLSTSAVALGSETSGNYVASLGSLTGLTAGGTSGPGAVPTLSVNYGSSANTAAQGNSALSFSGSGNLTGTVSGTAGGGFTANTLDIVSSPTFSGTLTVQGSGVTVGTSSQQGGLVLNSGNGAGNHAATLQGISTLGQDTVYTLPDPGGASATICLSTGNCAGSGGGITGSGTSGSFTKFNGSGSVTNSSNVSETGSVVTDSGSLLIQGSGGLTLGAASTTDGLLIFKNASGAHTVSLQAPATDPASNLVFKLPGADGLSGQCLTTNGSGALSFAPCLSGSGGGGGGVTSLNGLSGTLNLANASGSGATITINDAKADASTKGIATFNSTNFTDNGSGTINTAQDIAATSSPTFATVNATTGLNTGAGAGTERIDASGNLVNIGTISSGAINGQTISSSAVLTGTLTVQGSGVTVGTSSQKGSLILNSGNGASNHTATLQGIATLGQDTVYTLPDPGAGSATICLSTGNCASAGTAGGDLAGSYPNPTIAKLQGKTLTVSTTPVSGAVLQYNGSAFVDGLITNGSLQSGAFANITGTGALVSGSIGSGFGTISTANDITTSTTIQGNVLNGVTAIQLNGANINTAGTLSHVAYLNQANTFTAANIFQNTSNSTTAFQILNAAGSTTLFDADTTDGTIGIGQLGNSSYTLGVTGTINATSNIYVNGVAVCTVSSGCSGGGSGYYINNGTITQTGNFNVQAATSGSVAGILRANASGSGDILDLRNGSNVNVATVGSTGNVLFQNSANSTTAFQIQNAAGTGNTFDVDTSNSRVGIGTVTPTRTLDVRTSDIVVVNFQSSATGAAVLDLQDSTSSGNSIIRTYNSGTGQWMFGLDGSDGGFKLEKNQAGAFTSSAALTVASTGATTFKNNTNSTTAFRVQNAAASATVLDVDTTNGRVGVGTASPTAALTVKQTGSDNVFTGLNASGATEAYIDQYGNLWLNSGAIIWGDTTIHGNGLFQSLTNSTTAFQIQNASTSPLLVADTTNMSVGIAGASTTAGYALNVTGTGNFSTNLYVNGVAVCTVTSGCSGGGSGFYINNGTATQSGNFNVQAATSGSVAGILEANASGSGDILDLRNGSGVNVATVGSTGSTLFENSTNSTTAFQIQNAAGTSNLFVADTTNSKIGIGAAASAGSAAILQVTGSISATNVVSAIANFNLTNQSASGGQIIHQYTAGGTINGNDVVSLKSSGAAVVSSSVARDTQVYGVAGATGATVGNAVNVIIAGRTLVNADAAAIALGDQLVTTATAGVVTVDNGATTGIVGIATTTKGAGAGTVGIMVRPVGGQSAPRFQSLTNSTTAFQIQNSSAANLVQADTTNMSVGVAGASTTAGYALNVTGTGNFSTNLYVNGVAVCTVTSGCSGGGSGFYINNGTTTQTGNFNVQAATSGSVAGILEANAAGSGDILDLRNGSNVNVATVGSTGSTLFKNSTDSTTAFQIQDAAGTGNVLDVDTTNGRVGIGTNAPTVKLDVRGSALFKNAADSTTSFQIDNSSSVQVFVVDTSNQDVGVGAAAATDAKLFATANSATKATLRVSQLGSADILQAQAGSTNVFKIGGTGAILAQNSADSTSAFQIQNAAGTSNLLVADTTNSKVGIGLAPSSSGATLQVSGSVNATSNYQIGSNVVLQNPGTNNIFTGNLAGNASVSGTDNTANGVAALLALTSGSNNAALGYWALRNNTTGSNNTALGMDALQAAVSASNNTGVGDSALFNTTGGNNTGIGFDSLLSNSSGTNNVALGYTAGYTSTAANANTTGSGNTFLGYQSGPGVASSYSLQNATAIGMDSTVNQNNALILGCVSGVNGCSASTNVGIGSGYATNNPLSVSSTTYNTGTIAQTTTAITGTGTTWTAAMSGGTIIYNDGSTATVTFVDATHLTSSVSKTVTAGSAYTLVYAGDTFSSTGAFKLQNTSDSTSAFQIQNAAGTSLLTADTTNQKLIFGPGASGTAVLNTSTGVFCLGTCSTAKLNVLSSGIAVIVNETGSSDLLDLQNNAINVVSVGATGNSLFKNSTNSTTAFQIQNAAGTALLTADTVNSQTTNAGNFLVYSAGCSYANYTTGIAAQSPSAYWKLEDTGSTAADSSGNGNTGTINSATVNQTPGPFSCLSSKPAISFNGTSSNVSTTTTAASPTTFSLVVMFKTNSSGSLIDNTDMSFSNNINMYVGSDGKLYAGFYSTSFAVQLLHSPNAVNNNAWHMAVMTESPGAGMTLYLDGNQVAVNAAYNSPASASAKWLIGRVVNNIGWTNESTNYYAGLLGEVAVLPSALSAGTVTTLSTYAGLGNANIGIGTTTPTANLDDAGTALFHNNGDSTTAFQIQNAAGTSNLLVADTTNTRIGIGKAAPTYTLDVAGDVNTSTLYRIAGNVVLQAVGSTDILVGGAGNATMVDSYNIGVGGLALQHDTTGYGNVAIGYQALQGNTTGSNNNAIGYKALLSDTTGTDNMAFGAYALEFVTVGNHNTAIGSNALQFNTGSNNNGYGYQALQNNTSGNYNNALGGGALYSNTTGSSNTALGDGAGYTNSSGNANVTGSGNTFVGSEAGPGTATQLQNATAIGTNSIVIQSDSLVLGCINGFNGCTASTKVGIGTANPGATFNVVGTALFQSASNSSTAFQVQNSSSVSALVVSTNNVSGTYNAANAILDVAADSGTSRSINAAGTINASGADYAEWIPWNGAKPDQGSVVTYQGSDYVVSSPETAAFVGNDNIDETNAIMVTFAGQVPVKVTGTVDTGDILVDNGDGTARAINPANAQLMDYLSKIGIAQASSSDAGVKLIAAAIGTTASNASAGLQAGNASFSRLNISGLATISNLTVTGSATVNNLTVTGSASFANITISGHVITSGGQPVATAQSGAGADAAISVSGDDTTGTIAVTTGDAPAAGDLAQIEFSKLYGAAPHIVLSPSNDAASTLRYYKGATNASGFMFDTHDTPAANTTYIYDYFIAQ